MSHGDDSVHGKLDKILDSIHNKEHGLAVRMKKMEKAVLGDEEIPGLCEKVRGLQSENLRQTAFISTGISAIFGLAWFKIKGMFGN